MTQLTHYDNMRKALIQAVRVDEVKDIRDKAEALRMYYRQTGESLEMQNAITEIKARAERRAGELLMELERGTPNPDGLGRYQREVPDQADRELHVNVSEYRSTIADAGIPEGTARRWQQIASLPDERFERHIAEIKSSGKELTSASILREVAAFRREKIAEEKQDSPPLPDEKYRVIYADPPWQYDNRGTIVTESGAEVYTRVNQHYPTMPLEEICAMGDDIKAMAEDNSVLFLWTTSPFLRDAFKVVDAWGFTYKTSMVWNKERHTFGHYVSVRHEMLLICTRGACTPDAKELVGSVVTIPRSNRNSEKPEEFRRIIDTLYTWGKRIELFARRPVDGWDIWGNEA